MEIEQNLQINLVSRLSKSLKNFLWYAFRPTTYFKYIFHLKIHLFVPLKSDKDLHWSGSLDPDLDLY